MSAILTDGSPRRNPSGEDAVRVLKFGGTSVGTGERIMQSAELVLRDGGSPVVVVSAMGGVTNELALLARGTEPAGGTAVESGVHRTAPRSTTDLLASLEEKHLDAARAILSDGAARDTLVDAIRTRLGKLVRGGSPASSDAVMSTGEDLSVLLMTAALNQLAGGAALNQLAGGAPRARAVDARTIVRTDDRFGGAIPDVDETVELAHRRLLPLVEAGVIPVIQGFVGATSAGDTTTLGRGGSDFTAAIVGAALGAPEVTIWTDVDGIFTADPNQVPNARVLPELGFEEAVELAYFGARVIHPAAAKHAVGRQVALRIRNSFHPDRPGTLIRTDRRESPGVAALAFKPRVTLLTVRSRPLFMAYGFLARVFEVLTRNRVPVDLVATSHTSTAFTVDRDELLGTVREELDAFAEIEIRTGLGTVSAIGAGLLHMPGIAGQIFQVLGDTPIHLISQATDTSLSFVVDEPRGPEVVRRLHDALIDPANGDAP